MFNLSWFFASLFILKKSKEKSRLWCFWQLFTVYKWHTRTKVVSNPSSYSRVWILLDK